MSHCIEDIASKIKRADKHIQDFRTAAIEFMRSNPYGITVEVDPNIGNKIYTLTKVPPIPSQIRLIAGDAIQNMRSALDYLACGLVRTNKAEPSKYVSFPISDSMPTTKDEQAAFARQVKGMRQDAINAIKSTKPYKGGDNTLWRLHRLNVIDKHRLLMAAGTCLSVVDPRFMTKLRDYLVTGIEPPPYATVQWKNRFPLKTGDKFSLNLSGTSMEINDEPFLEIALNEPGVAEGEVLISVLKQSLHSVQEVIGNLARFL